MPKTTESDEMTTGCIATLVILACAPLTYTLRGWVLCVLWGWFVAPVFGLPPLRIPQALGLALLIGMLTHTVVDCVQPKRTLAEECARGVAGAVFAPLFVLGIAWIIHLFAG